MPIEAYALMGWKRWDRVNGYPCRLQSLSHGRDLLVVRSGSGMDHAGDAARCLISQGASSLMVLGLSGGLLPLLRPGDLIVADSVLEENGREIMPVWKTDHPFIKHVQTVMMNKGLSCYRGAVVTCPDPVMTMTRKRDLFARTRALAVDMESAAVARAAAEAGLPLFIFRTVSDGASTSLPADITACFDETGNLDPARFFCRIVRKPALLPPVCAVARDCIQALHSLRKAWNLQVRTGLPCRLSSGR